MTDNAELRKYRIELPNLIDEIDISVYAFRLYVHMRRVAGASGTCFEGTRALAERCRMSMGKVSEAKQELIDKRLITQIGERPTRGGLVPEYQLADLWEENYERYAGVHYTNTTDESVHHVNTKPESVHESVHGMNVKRSPRERKKEHEERTSKKEDAAPRKARARTTREKKETVPEVVITTLADECKIDRSIATKTQRDQLYQSAGILARAGAKQDQAPEQIADAIHYVAGYFRTKDWRGKKGQSPTPALIREVWREAIDARAASTNGYLNGRSLRSNTGQNPERAQWTTELTDEL